MTWVPQDLPAPSAPIEVTAPSGRVIGWTNDAPTAGQFQAAGYITL